MPKKAQSDRKNMAFQKWIFLGLQNEWVGRSFGRNS